MGDTQTTQLTDNEKLARLQLIRTPKIGPATYSQLLVRHQTAINSLEYLAFERPSMPIADKAALLLEIEALDRFGGKFLFLGEASYPQRLAAIPDAPPIIAVKGDLSFINQQTIGVVGARNASAAGLKLTRRICTELSANQVTVISGLARGIDTEAHRASLTGGTIACIAGGLDIVYPQENKNLYAEISEKGLLISEMPFGTQPQARHFPRRNRIISGLSEGLLVVEAAKKSGSLITARFAADQGRDVFAIPGSPLDPRAQGTNQLIKDGAILTQSATDILNELASMPLLRTPVFTGNNKNSPLPSTAKEHKTIKPITTGGLLSFLSPDPTHIDEIVRLSGAPTEKIICEFTSLELAGEITRHSGNRFSRISRKNE